MGFSTFDERQPILNQFVIHDTDGTNTILAVNPNQGPTRVDTWSVLTVDTVAREYVVQIQNASAIYEVCYRFTVPGLAGTAGHAVFDVLAAILPPTNQGLVLPANQAMQVGALVALSAATYMTSTLIGGVI